MAHKSHFLPIDKLKIRLGEVEKAMIQVVARHWELIFFLLTSPKCGLCYVEKAMFQVVTRHSEIIFSLLNTTKCCLCVQESNVSSGCKALRKHFLPLD